MKLLVLTLLAVSIGSTWATATLPRGCGEAFIRAANAMRPQLNCEGNKIIDRFDEGINEFRCLIANGDIRGQIINLKDVGVLGMKKLPATTHNGCLKRVFPHLGDMDVEVANQIKRCDAQAAAYLVCNLLKYKAQEIQNCLYCQ